jgi:hypothetical protein
MLLASGIETAIESLTGWPLSVVVCVVVISIASAYMGRWPW